MRIKMIVPFPMDSAGVSNRAAQIPDELLLPGTTVDFVAVKNSAIAADTPYDAFIMQIFVFEEGLRSESEGYDAVCMDTVSDSALSPLRSRLTIPVVGPGQVGWYLSCVLGHRFSIITLSDKWVPFYSEWLGRYGLMPKLASIRSIGKEPDLVGLIGEDDNAFEELEEAARRAVREDGADVIVLGSTTMHEAYSYLRERLECPVINPGLVAVKVAELLVSLGLSHSKAAYPAPSQTVDESIFERLAPARQV